MCSRVRVGKASASAESVSNGEIHSLGQFEFRIAAVGMNNVTGDGRSDILWRNKTTGQFLLWEMNGLTIKSRFDIQSADFTLNRSAVSMTQQRVNPVQEVKLPQGSVLWRDELNGNTVGLWNFNSTTQGPQAGLTEQLWSGAVGVDWKVEGIGDMNGDGISDVLWRNTGSNQVTVWELNGSGGLNLVNVPALTYVDSNWKVKGLSDMDGDRRSDVIWQNDISRQLVVWKMDGRQMLAGPLVTNETGGQLLATAGETLEQVVDWDGDGKGDFFWRNTTTNAVSVWLMNGTQRRGVMTLSNALMSVDWKLEGIGDSNGDRRGEVLWRNKTTGEVKLWEMGAGNAVVQKSLGIVSSSWDSLGFADFTLDGKADITWRNGQTQEVQIWEMDGTGVKTKYTRSGAEYKSSRKAIGALQGKTISVPLSVSLTAESDTGISNSDGITKNRTPVVSGVAMPSATVTLYANNQIVGSTIAASNGQWSVTSQELADGNYELSASIQTVQGSVIQQKIKTITIDGTAPQIASVTGLMDGVAWDASDVFSGTLRDVDNLTQLQYWINNGTKQTIGLTANASNLNFNNITFSQISTLSANAEHKLYLKAIDRAGNETQYDYSFMRLDLPEMTEDTDWTGPVGGGSDDRTGSGSGSTGGALPSGAGGYYYIGVGGGWGYSSGSGGGGDWTPENFGGGGVPSLPTKPGQDPNEQLTYLQALNVILNTAVDALSKHSSVVSKKQVLGEFKSDLLAMGKVIEFYGLHESFKTQFNELFSLGYDKTDNRVSWREAVMAGWKFAKSVALDSKPVRLKAFESQLFGMVRGMMVRENISLSAIQEQELKQTLETFSRRYAVLNPARSQYSWNSYYSGFEEMIWGIGIRGRVSGRWSWNNSSGVFSNGPAIENGWLGWDSFKHLKGLLQGLNARQIIDGFENTHILISGATRTATLRRSGAAHVRFGEFLNQLMETGFTLTRVGATNPAGLATSTSAWLEGVLEKNVQLVAGGLGQFFQGLDATSSYWGWSDRPYTNIFADTLDYGQRLMKAAAGVRDLGLKAQMLRSDVLSELVNLGGAYAALIPNVGQPIVEDILPLHSVLLKNYSNQQSLQIDSINDLMIYLQQSGKPLESIKISKVFLKEFKNDINCSNNWSNLNWINSFFRVTRPYDTSSLIDNVQGFTLVGSFERSLTDWEIEYLKDTFGNSIDYSKIRVVRGDMRSAASSTTYGNTIYLNDFWGNIATFQKDGSSITADGLILLSHEITHVWQFQNGGWEYASAALMANFRAFITTGKRENAYNWEEAYRYNRSWDMWNPEQQAKAMQDYTESLQIIRRSNNPNEVKPARATLRILQRFVDEVRARRGAPQTERWTDPTRIP